MFSNSDLDWKGLMKESILRLREVNVDVRPPRNLELHESKPDDQPHGKYLSETDTIHIYNIREKNKVKTINIYGEGKTERGIKDSIDDEIRMLIEHELIHRWQAYRNSKTPKEIRKIAPKLENNYKGFFTDILELRKKHNINSLGILDIVDNHTDLFEWRDIEVAANIYGHRKQLNQELKQLDLALKRGEDAKKHIKTITGLLKTKNKRSEKILEPITNYKGRLQIQAPVEGMAQFWSAYRDRKLYHIYSNDNKVQDSHWVANISFNYKLRSEEEVKKYLIQGYEIYKSYLDENLSSNKNLDFNSELEKEAVKKSIKWYKNQIRFPNN